VLCEEQQGLSTVIKKQLEKVGIELVVKLHEAGSIHSMWKNEDHNMVLTSYCWPDPQILNKWFAFDSNGQNNWAHYMNPKLGELFLEAEKTTYSGERAEIYRRVQEYLLIDAVCIPLFGKSVVYGIRKEIEGIEYSITGYPIFYEAYFTE
jgi:peptide/nickel transport system substrate-binding protein